MIYILRMAVLNIIRRWFIMSLRAGGKEKHSEDDQSKIEDIPVQ